MENVGTVRLVEGMPFDVATRGVTATLRRSDIEEAARSADVPAELLLDVTRGEGADVEAHSLAIEWNRTDLDQLLRDADTADNVTIAFDRDEMVAAIDAEADVEAHGLREKALVFTVVAVSAASTAGVAQARPTSGPAGGTAASVTAPVQAPATTVGGAGSGTTTDPAASPATTIGGAGVEPAELGGSTTAAPATVTGGASASGVTSPSVSPATTIGGAGAPVASPAGARGGSAASDGGGGSSPLSGDEAALLGAAGIAIAAAGFAAAGKRRRPIQPAEARPGRSLILGSAQAGLLQQDDSRNRRGQGGSLSQLCHRLSPRQLFPPHRERLEMGLSVCRAPDRASC
jgi:hypothetical protein